ncbi:Voltage-dependent calcium channel subunit alpha-2/delta-4, partial [Dissostichus eleginoides]
YKDGKKLKPKPNYNSVDMSEVEWEDTEETLRTAMVRGQTGSMRLSVRASVDKAKRPLYLVNDYFYTNIDETPFSIASEWTYCVTDIDPSYMKFSQLQAAIRYLLGLEPDMECDEVLLRHVLFDAVVTAPMEAYWNALMLNDKVEPGVETAFLGTRSGLLRLTRYTGVESRVAKKFLTAADKANLFTMDHFPLWYRLAVENTPGSFYYYPVNDKGVKYVIAVTSATVSSEGKTAIAGGFLSPDVFECPGRIRKSTKSSGLEASDSITCTMTSLGGVSPGDDIRQYNNQSDLLALEWSRQQ